MISLFVGVVHNRPKNFFLYECDKMLDKVEMVDRVRKKTTFNSIRLQLWTKGN